MFQKRSADESIRLSIRDNAHPTRSTYVYFLSEFRLTEYLRRNPAEDSRTYEFDNQDLSGIDFSGLDLRRTNFKNAVLHDAVFKDARLDGADMTNADLTGACFDKDQLPRTIGKPRYGPEGPLTAARIIKMRSQGPKSP